MSGTKPKVINGISFNISQPYEAGHTLSELEAKVLNQTRSENVGNNVRAKVKLMIEGDETANPPVAPSTFEEIQAYVASVDADYIFRTVSEGAGRSVDPYEKEARRMAREFLKNELSATGRKITVTPDDLTDDEWKDKVENEIDRLANLPQITADAKKNVDARKKQNEKLLEVVGGVTI
jgi:hypothetical protein